MGNRTLTRLAWLVLALVLGCTALSLGLRAGNADTPVPEGWGPRGLRSCRPLSSPSSARPSWRATRAT